MTLEAVAAYTEAYGRFIEAGERHAVSQERLAQAQCAEVLARREEADALAQREAAQGQRDAA